MAHVTIELPSLLSGVIGGRQSIPADGATLRDALADAYRQAPALRVHLCDESGDFRQHVLCFINDTNARWLDGLDQALQDGDCITILQAVSGGSTFEPFEPLNPLNPVNPLNLVVS